MTKPNALLLISTHCPHCATVLQGLSELLKSGLLAKLEVINISNTPEVAQEYAVRSVPWTRIGVFELEGLQSLSELKHWAQQAESETGMREYFHATLKSGGLNKVLNILQRDANQFTAIIALLQDPDIELPVRIGIGAVMEEYEGTTELQARIGDLAELTRHSDPRIRLDACHYLALTHSSDAISQIELLLKDEDPEVKEVAKESLDSLRNS